VKKKVNLLPTKDNRNSMESNDILLTTEENVGIITFNRPTKGNSITSSMFARFKIFLDQLEKDPKIRVIIITGNGKFFCTGMDLGSSNQTEMKSTSSPSSDPDALFSRIRKSRKVVISMVQGPIYAGGWGIFFSTDIRIVIKTAYFQMTEVKRGITPALISGFITPQLGLFKTKQFMITGESVSAVEMERMGVISYLAENEKEMENKLNYYLEEIIGGAPTVIENVKYLTEFISNPNHSKNMEEAISVFRKSISSPEAFYGISSFSQKQKPDWKKFYQENPRSKL